MMAFLLSFQEGVDSVDNSGKNSTTQFKET